VKKLFLLSLICLGLGSAYAQDEVSQPKLKSEFGFHMGATTGMGLSYRHWFNKTGIQLTALPIKTDDYKLISAGFTLMHSFYESNYSRFYGYLGSHFWNNRYKEWEWLDNNETEHFVEEKKFNLGIGPAFAFGKRVRFNVMAGYGFYDIFGELNMLPTGEIGLYYCF
jgi:hypothetical protein